MRSVGNCLVADTPGVGAPTVVAISSNYCVFTPRAANPLKGPNTRMLPYLSPEFVRAMHDERIREAQQQRLPISMSLPSFGWPLHALVSQFRRSASVVLVRLRATA
jgi:hypothetical protein